MTAVRALYQYFINPMIIKPLIIVAFCTVCVTSIGRLIKDSNSFKEDFDLVHSLSRADYSELLRPIGHTLLHAAVIVSISVTASVVVVALCVKFRAVRFVVVPITDFFRAIPATLLCPLVSIVFPRDSDLVLCLLCSIPCTSIVIFSLLAAFDGIPAIRYQIYRLNKGHDGNFTLAFWYYYNALLPAFASAVKLIMSYAIVMACVLEMLGYGNNSSVGVVIVDWTNSNGGNMGGTPMVLILAMGLISYWINAGISQLEIHALAKRY
jgi:ABC-type nitrate/sulfonate/bicarbonate transport system permease component